MQADDLIPLWQDLVREAASRGERIRIHGGGSEDGNKNFVGHGFHMAAIMFSRITSVKLNLLSTTVRNTDAKPES